MNWKYKQPADALIATGRIVAVAVDTKTEKSIRVPDGLREAVSRFEEEPTSTSFELLATFLEVGGFSRKTLKKPKPRVRLVEHSLKLKEAVSPSPFSFNASVEPVVMAAIGGLASIWGAPFGVGVTFLIKDLIQSRLEDVLHVRAASTS